MQAHELWVNDIYSMYLGLVELKFPRISGANFKVRWAHAAMMCCHGCQCMQRLNCSAALTQWLH